MTPTGKKYEFVDVLELFEKNGWKLHRIVRCYRVFTKPGEVPCVIPVKNRKVDAVYVEEVVQFFSEKERSGKRPN